MDDIFFEYSINAEEGNDSVSVLLKFKEYDEYGQAISIEPGGVSLDGVSLAADSTPMTGPFYALNKHINDFTGKHRIEVVLPDQHKYRDEFNFQPFSVRSPIPDTLKRAKLQLEFNGLYSGEVVRLTVTDTSFTGDGIQRLDSIWNNRMLITKNELSFLQPRPINLELTRESVQKLPIGTGAGGVISISYSIRKECWLRD